MWLRLLYNLIVPFVFTVFSPYYIYRMRRRGRVGAMIKERLGFYSAELNARLAQFQSPLWIHAVSVGEVMVAQALIREIRQLRPAQQIVLTVTTQTGRAVAQKLEDAQTIILYSPLDLPWIVEQTFNKIRPTQYILVEGEIWPNALWAAHDRGIRISLINARLSNRSWRRYHKWSRFLKPVLDLFTWIGVQHISEVQRLAQAGFPHHKLFVTGSLKFDVTDPHLMDTKRADTLRAALGWDKNDPVLFGGSTHPGEEKILMKIFQKLRASHPKLRLFLAPRHVERVQELIAEAQAFDIKLARKSELNGSAPYSSVILDTTGELKELYPLGSIVFIGKSLTGIGGQNFLEPAKYGCAIVAGPELSNFSALAQLFLQDQSLVQVRDEQQLEKEISTLFNQPSERRQLGQNAATLFKRHLGAARKTAEMILS